MDPFGTVLADAERQLSSAQLILRQYKNEPTQSRLTDLSTLLHDLTGIVRELSESIIAVQSNPGVFGLDHAEINRRVEQVGHINYQITDIQEALASARKVNPMEPRNSSLQHNGQNPFSDPIERQNNKPNQDQGQLLEELNSVDPDGEPTEQDRMLLYQEAIDEQDTILDSVFTTVQNLREQANLMSQELEDQAVMLDDFEAQVDRSEDRLGRARRRIDWVLRNNRDTLSSCCIGLLIVVLVVLLVLVVVA